MLDLVVFRLRCITVSSRSLYLSDDLMSVVCVQLGSIISANIYQVTDKPLYRHGNRALIGINVLAILLFLFAKVYYIVKNRTREKKWQAMTPEVGLLGRFGTVTDRNCRRGSIIFTLPQTLAVGGWTLDSHINGH
jgi:hypothetical protein